jgi:hypothetical protein
MRGWIAVLLACAPGCRQVFGLEPTQLADASVDVATDTSPPCFGTAIVQVCPATTPTGALKISVPVATGSSTLCVPYQSPNNTMACVIAASSITIPQTVRVTGPLPLVLVADSITVSGGATLDVASHRADTTGAGADFAGCPNGMDATAVSGTAGGGWGGSFHGKGGDGSAGTTGGAGGTAPAAFAISAFHGGCPGGDGAAMGGGARGHGGGAVFLIATTQILIDGAIDASGSAANGGSGSLNAGGGGGGAGGMIGLDAPTIVVSSTANVFANGGGGGEGCDSSAGNDGVPGSESTSATSRGVGGAGVSIGGDGGDGSVGVTLAGGAAKPANGGMSGGGGGGGGAGAIRMFPLQVVQGAVSPPPS